MNLCNVKCSKNDIVFKCCGIFILQYRVIPCWKLYELLHSEKLFPLVFPLFGQKQNRHVCKTTDLKNNLLLKFSMQLILFEKIIGIELVTKFFSFYWKRSFIALLQDCTKETLSTARWIQSLSSPPYLSIWIINYPPYKSAFSTEFSIEDRLILVQGWFCTQAYQFKNLSEYDISKAFILVKFHASLDNFMNVSRIPLKYSERLYISFSCVQVFT
jgi:hypothetical protein